jgi:hypothetical protein
MARAIGPKSLLVGLGDRETSVAVVTAKNAAFKPAASDRAVNFDRSLSDPVRRWPLKVQGLFVDECVLLRCTAQLFFAFFRR